MRVSLTLAPFCPINNNPDWHRLQHPILNFSLSGYQKHTPSHTHVAHIHTGSKDQGRLQERKWDATHF